MRTFFFFVLFVLLAAGSYATSTTTSPKIERKIVKARNRTGSSTVSFNYLQILADRMTGNDNQDRDIKTCLDLINCELKTILDQNDSSKLIDSFKIIKKLTKSIERYFDFSFEEDLTFVFAERLISFLSLPAIQDLEYSDDEVLEMIKVLLLKLQMKSTTSFQSSINYLVTRINTNESKLKLLQLFKTSMLSDYFYFISPNIFTLGYIDDPLILDNFILDCVRSINGRFTEYDMKFSPIIRILLVISSIKPNKIKPSVEVARAIFASLEQFQTINNTDPAWLSVLIPSIHHIISSSPAVSSDLELYNLALEWSFSEAVISNLNDGLDQDYSLLVKSFPEASIQEKKGSLSSEMNEKFAKYDPKKYHERSMIRFLVKRLDEISIDSNEGYFKVTIGSVLKYYEMNIKNRIADQSMSVHSTIQKVYPKLKDAFRERSHPNHRSSLLLIFHLSRLDISVLRAKECVEASANVMFSLAHLISSYETDAEVLELFEYVKPRLQEFMDCLLFVFNTPNAIHRNDLSVYIGFFKFLKDRSVLSDNFLKKAKNLLCHSFFNSLPISVKGYKSIFLIPDIDHDSILTGLLLNYITKHTENPNETEAAKDKVFLAEFYFHLVESKSISLTEKLLLEQILKQLNIIN